MNMKQSCTCSLRLHLLSAPSGPKPPPILLGAFKIIFGSHKDGAHYHDAERATVYHRNMKTRLLPYLTECLDALSIQHAVLDSPEFDALIYNTVSEHLESDFDVLPDYTRVTFESGPKKFSFIQPYIQGSLTSTQLV